jgi:glycosyltransferase involved in cell wall biosynthesis
MTAIRLAWLATHPIQYQAPLLRAIAQYPDIELTVLFFSDFSTRSFVDPDFGRAIEWDTPLLDGYRYELLPGTGALVNGIQTFQPRVRGLAQRLNLRNFDAVLVQGWQHYAMVKAAWLAKRAGLKVLMRCEATDHVSSSTGAKRLLREATVRFLLNQVDCCLAIGTHNRNFYLARGLPIDRIGSMPYCVDNDHFRNKAQATDIEGMRAELNLEPGRPVVLYASKLMARKFPDLLLDAYQRLPEPRPYLIYVGDGELRAELERKVSNCGLEGVRILGFRNQSELPAFYALADIFVLPSINETWGLVVNEAMNAGCAVIATDQVGSATDLVRSGENGFIINAQDVAQLTGALARCIEQERFRKMGERSIQIISEWGIRENIFGLRSALGLKFSTNASTKSASDG